jgi:predicted DNA-binding transcriptional regulator AlpA
MILTSHPLQELLNENDVARILKVSVATIRRRRLLRQAPHPVKIGASVRYTPESIARLLAESQTGGEKQVQGGLANSSVDQRR